MQAEKTYSKGHAILVTPQHLKYFDDFLEKNYEKAVYIAHCSDATEITFSSIKELLSYENPSFKRIISLTN